MHRTYRMRGVLKWVGVGLTSAVLAAWVVSYWYRSCITAYPGTLAYAIEFSHGLILLWRVPDVIGANPNVFGINPSVDFEVAARESRHLIPDLLASWDNPHYPPVWFETRYLFLAFAIPTVWLWWRDRPRGRLGCCLRCGYDLTGNISGVCSECGLPVAATDKKSGR